jgi:hypothetical protein
MLRNQKLKKGVFMVFNFCDPMSLMILLLAAATAIAALPRLGKNDGPDLSLTSND